MSDGDQTGGSPFSVTDPTDLSVRCHVVSCIHGRPRFCSRCLGHHRRVSRLLDELMLDLYPPMPRQPPCDFGLTPAELRRHANQLVLTHGWSPAEVQQVLEIPKAVT